ncbi:hypothetical protein IAR55_003797 [Kwoniella newhampshirensis]|uniref:Uncharacterized protein n=1 Tax=Kwoniella newhampshirensis TaxID=1651941 RepID=A0AAW0YL03_9TREE
MVSLRERKSRASYTDVAQGLEDLSSGDEGQAGSGTGAASGSGSGEDSGSDNDDDEDKGDTSFSSGASSEFRPDSTSPDRGKGRALPTVDSPNDEDDLIYDEVEDDDEENIDPALRSMSMTHTPGMDFDIDMGMGMAMAGPSRKALVNQRQKRPTQTITRSTSIPFPLSSASQPTHGQSEIYLLDLAYREAIRQSTLNMTFQNPVATRTDKERHNDRGKDQTRLHGTDAFPPGHPTPFSTRLLQTPTPDARGRSPAQEVEWVDESANRNVGPLERKDKRKKDGWSSHSRLTVGHPWELWRGEGWWPEMYLGAGGDDAEGSSAVASGKREDWLMKEDVRLGLGDIGTYKVEDMMLLNEEEAELYLPTPINQHGDPWTTCYVGPHDQQVPVNFEMFDSKSFAETNSINPRIGHTFFAGGPIWGMDWCPYPASRAAEFGDSQYLAVSTLPHIDTRPAMYEKWPRTSHGSIQIWSLRPGFSVAVDGDDVMNGAGFTGTETGGMTCELVLCVQGGPVMEIRWMPLGVWDDYDLSTLGRKDTPVPKLGILVAVQLDGTISFYPVPHPRFVKQELPSPPIYLRLDEPLLRLEVPDASCMCFDWLTGTRIAAGLSNGHVAVWDIFDALASGDSTTLLPSIYTTISGTAIRSIAAGRTPPSDDQLGSEPIYLVTGTHDGSCILLDLRDPLYPVELSHSRVPCMTVGWAQQMASPITVDTDFVVTAIKVRKSGQGRGHHLSSHRGQVWGVATSDYHTMLVSGGTDGAVILGNYHTGFYRNRKMPLVQERLYEVDYNATTGEYRILDDILPEAISLEAASSRRPAASSRRGHNEPPSHLLKTGAWSPHVGIHQVVWNNGGGLGKAGWVASGGASGLGRVEWVEGRWRDGIAAAVV